MLNDQDVWFGLIEFKYGPLIIKTLFNEYQLSIKKSLLGERFIDDWF